MVEVVCKRYDLDIESDYLGNMILLTILVDLVESDIPELSDAYQKAWDQLPDHLLFAFTEHHGIVT